VMFECSDIDLDNQIIAETQPTGPSHVTIARHSNVETASITRIYQSRTENRKVSVRRRQN
jgi:hypothetical protein